MNWFVETSDFLCWIEHPVQTHYRLSIHIDSRTIQHLEKKFISFHLNIAQVEGISKETNDQFNLDK